MKRLPDPLGRHALALCTLWLAACGGGGGGGGESRELSGNVTLQGDAEVATPSSISATLPAGASGQPACTLNTGQLPPGMVLTGCTLQGTPSTTGTFVSSLTLTLPGYSGSTRVDATLTIGGPFLGPSSAPTGTGLVLGSPVTGLSIFGLLANPPFVRRPTDTVVYRIVSGSLPAGLVWDPNNGLISGTPTQAGVFPITLGATLTRGSVSYQLADYVSVGVTVLSF